MTTLEQLPPDQRAVLSLLLRRRKRYDEVASALRLGTEAVHDRAHAALAVLAPRQARQLDHAARERIGEYLLGQQDAQQAAATKAHLAGSAPAREWARALAAELVKLDAQSMPEIPDDPQEGPPASPLADPISSSPSVSSPPISRRGGAVVLGAIAIVAVIAVAIVLSTGKGGGANGSQSSDTKSNASQTRQSNGKARLEKEAALKAAQPGSKAEGAAFIATEGSKRALYMAAKGLPASNGFSYVVWLIPTHGSPFAFGRTPSVGAKGSFQAAELLTTDPGTLSGIEITRETSPRPSAPGTVVLKGTFKAA